MTEPTSAQDLFKGRHFDQEIIIMCVRLYLAFKLSSRDLVQMMAERGNLLAHTTILRWVQRYVPDFENRWQAYARPVGDSWRVDEAYIKVKGQCVYLYRAVDKAGRTVDFLLSRRRDMAAARAEGRNPTEWLQAGSRSAYQAYWVQQTLPLVRR
jgi:transposase-like protein